MGDTDMHTKRETQTPHPMDSPGPVDLSQILRPKAEGASCQQSRDLSLFSTSPSPSFSLYLYLSLFMYNFIYLTFSLHLSLNSADTM